MAGTAPDPSPYIFSRDHKSSIRLNYQHMLIKQLCDGRLLHPAVHRSVASSPFSSPFSSIRVADVATGTALWLTELSDALPEHSELHGFDISPDQYPPPEWLPQNVSLHEHDAFRPFAPEFLGSFDVVNLRFFITLLDEENIRPLLSNLKSLLRPGGFLHWLDFDPRSARAIATRHGQRMPHTESVVSMMRGAQPDVNLWLQHGSDLFKSIGLDPVAYERIQLRNHLRPLWNHCHIMGMEELSRRMSRSTDGGGGEPSPQLLQLRDLEIEFAQGTSIDTQWFMMIGQLPGI